MAERSFPDDMLSDSYHSDAYHPDSGNSDAYYPNWDHSDLDQSGTSSHDVGGMSDVSSGHTEIIPRQSSNLDSQVRDGHQVEVGEEDDGFVLPDGVEAVPGSRSVNYQGYPYSFYHGGFTRSYRCSAYRCTHCLAKLYVSRMGVDVQGRHNLIAFPICARCRMGLPQPSSTGSTKCF
ncbi:hypothetical protein PC129_g3645 [Phytophthora cactorum]|uniref:Uncharacterized protein n=1 Tax=Phytophthora cactorum TaxID=29920 RepID=A0A8T1DG14_9STRA|nr:hypothetical protein Pcac1_g7907 [Phytophthora cactorum]KAG2842583.1 hypothetical protein PC112_g2941 [Phytophthora cactorum]KAG2842972.1 hypothetical protein PC111_g2515 [Phytophthora cactorum]KAG2866440.1 hypothetical protein PC113_g2847 [Phytophthora cactorum]KAG2931132.1 hypothetical protein PC114_g2261 [Phytophthora cactorum]